jgi:hypothetical protein
MKKNKIGWQKYEDVIEKQLSSPILASIMKNMAKAHQNLEDSEPLEEEEEDEDVGEMYEEMEYENSSPQIFPVSQKLLEELIMLSNFDCWMGHTNFDITPKIKEQLDSIPGVEVLKICSRYRFFIGIGNMFDFKEVRKIIEKELLKG